MSLEFFIAFAGAVGILWGTFRGGATKSLNESNAALRSLLNDQKLEIDSFKLKLEDLEMKVRYLEEHNVSLQILIKNALQEYFENNPSVAIEHKKKVDNKS